MCKGFKCKKFKLEFIKAQMSSTPQELGYDNKKTKHYEKTNSAITVNSFNVFWARLCG